MIFQPITLKHIPIGIALSHDIVNSRSEIILKKGTIVKTFEEQLRFLSQNLYVCTQSAATNVIPQDEYTYFQSHPILFLEHLHDFLYQHSRQVQLPLNFQDLMVEKVHLLSDLNNEFSSLMLLHCHLHSHPGNAILNAIQTALFCDLLAKHLKISQGEHEALLCASLSMNITLYELQDFLSSQGRPPTPGERTSILNHPIAARKILESCGVTNTLWLDIVLAHHEEPSGKGYPHKLAFPKIPPLCHLLRMADCFVALMTSRNTRAGLTPLKAFEQLKEPHAGFNTDHLEFMVKSLGPFPPGSLVQQISNPGPIYFCLMNHNQKTIMLSSNGSLASIGTDQLQSAGSLFNVLCLDSILYSSLRLQFVYNPLTFSQKKLLELL